jgi:hypothetical protein
VFKQAGAGRGAADAEGGGDRGPGGGRAQRTRRDGGEGEVGGRGERFIHQPGAAGFIHQLSGAVRRTGWPRVPVQRVWGGGVSGACRLAFGRGLSSNMPTV